MNDTIDIYVINLDKDVDRYTSIETKLKPNRFIRIQGILGKDLDVSQKNDEVMTLSKYIVPK